jgi:quercetin dioxygenase-like cupin family protein
MVEVPAGPGEIVDLALVGRGQETRRQASLIKTNDVHVVQILVPAGKEVPTHEAEGQIILHCLEGRVAVNAIGECRELKAGQLLYLVMNEPFSIQGVQHASVLVTIIRPKRGLDVELIGD